MPTHLKRLPRRAASSNRLVIQGSFTGDRANGHHRQSARGEHNVAHGLMGECSMSSQMKSKPMFAACTATSTLFTLMTMPITGWPFFNLALTGFSHREGRAVDFLDFINLHQHRREFGCFGKDFGTRCCFLPMSLKVGRVTPCAPFLPATSPARTE